MRRRELIGLALVSVALWLTLVSISSAIADSLPGREAQRRWVFTALGFGDASLIGLDRTPKRSFRPGCSTYLVLFFGLTGAALWASGAYARRRESALRRERWAWSAAAFSRVIENVARAAWNGESDLASAIGEARRAVRPYLVEPYRWIFDRSFERFASPRSPATPPPSWPGKRRWPRLVGEAFLVVAAVMVGIGVISGVGIASFDELPELGMPLGLAAVFEGVAVWMGAAASWVFVALGLRHLDRQATSADAGVVLERRDALAKLAEQLAATGSSLADRSGAGSCAHRVVSALAMTLLEATPLRDRADLLSLLDAASLKAPIDLGDVADLRSSRPPSLPAGRDAWAVGAEIWSLLCLHGAVLVGAALWYLTGLWAHIPLGWFRAPADPHTAIYSSPLGAAIVGVPFLLATALLLGLAWVLRRSATRS